MSDDRPDDAPLEPLRGAAEPTRDDFRRFEFECPQCGCSLAEYAECCPDCGQNLFEVYSGTFRPRRTKGAKVVAVLLLSLLVGSMILGLVVVMMKRVGG